MNKALAGLGVAIAVTLVAADATFFGIEAWKYILALIGFALFVKGRR